MADNDRNDDIPAMMAMMAEQHRQLLESLPQALANAMAHAPRNDAPLRAERANIGQVRDRDGDRQGDREPRDQDRAQDRAQDRGQDRPPAAAREAQDRRRLVVASDVADHVGLADKDDIDFAAAQHVLGNNGDAQAGAIPVLVAAVRRFSRRTDPTRRLPFQSHDALDATSWALHLRDNDHAVDAIISELEKYFRTTLSGTHSTVHMIMLALQSFVRSAGRNPDLADDPYFCEGANLLIRELIVDQMAKNGTEAPGLQAARDIGRSLKLPDAIKNMHSAAIERNKQAKKGN